MQSLTVVDQKYVLRDNLLAYTVQDHRYLEPILQAITKVMLERSDEAGFAVLGMMTTLLPEGVVRKPTDYDLMDFNLKRHSEDRAKLLGKRFTCEKCHRKFYDMHRELKCPLCDTPVASASSI